MFYENYATISEGFWNGNGIHIHKTEPKQIKNQRWKTIWINYLVGFQIRTLRRNIALHPTIITRDTKGSHSHQHNGMQIHDCSLKIWWKSGNTTVHTEKLFRPYLNLLILVKLKWILNFFDISHSFLSILTVMYFVYWKHK